MTNNHTRQEGHLGMRPGRFQSLADWTFSPHPTPYPHVTWWDLPHCSEPFLGQSFDLRGAQQDLSLPWEPGSAQHCSGHVWCPSKVIFWKLPLCAEAVRQEDQGCGHTSSEVDEGWRAPGRAARKGSSSHGAKPGAGPLSFQLSPVPYDSGPLAQEFPAFPGTAFPPPRDTISHRCPAHFPAAPAGRGRPHSERPHGERRPTL